MNKCARHTCMHICIYLFAHADPGLCRERTLAAATRRMASVIFLVFLTEEMRPRMAFDLPSMVGPGWMMVEEGGWDGPET